MTRQYIPLSAPPPPTFGSARPGVGHERSSASFDAPTAGVSSANAPDGSPQHLAMNLTSERQIPQHAPLQSGSPSPLLC